MLISESDGSLETKKEIALKRYKYHRCTAKWKNPLCDVSLLEEAAGVAVKVTAASLLSILLQECCFFYLSTHRPVF